MNSFKSFLIRVFFKFFIRFIVYAASLIPFCYSLVLQTESNISKILLLIISILSCPFLIIIISGLLYAITPKVESGSYKIFSPPFIKWFLKDVLADLVLSSSLLNNIANRIDFLKSIFYRLLGVSNPDTIIMASDVILLDPNRFIFGNNIFIGYSTMISGHFVKNRQLVLTMGEIKNNVQIGACCKIAQGVNIGNNVIIGFGVTIGVNCIIGDNTVIHDATILDDNCVVGENSVVGKKCLIGRKSVVKNNCFIGNYSSIGSSLKIKENSKVSELSVIKKDLI